MGDDTLRHLRALKPDSPVLRYFPAPQTCPKCGDDHPFDRDCARVFADTDDERRAAFARMARAVAGLLNQP